MPEPLQIADDGRRLAPDVISRAAIFGRVSVVMIASAAGIGVIAELIDERGQGGGDPSPAARARCRPSRR